MTGSTPSNLNEAFNARFLQSADVGSTFVSSPALREMLSSRHTAVIGPRGSGKTTLLKMLTLPALMRWKGPGRDEILRNLDFISAYIAASLTWSANFRSFSGVIDRDVERILSVSLFRHHSMLALIDTWAELRELPLRDDPVLGRFALEGDAARDAVFARALAHDWGLDIATSTRGGLARAAKTRIRDLQRLTVRAASVTTRAERLLDELTFLPDHFLDDASVFVDLVEETYGKRMKLALCFDEVEITTASVAKAITSSIRSVDQRLLIKYSAAPYVGMSAEELVPHAPTQMNDFKLVFLTTFSSKASRSFSENLFTSLATRFGEVTSAREILGPSLIEEGGRDEVEKYGPGGAYQKRFKSLASIDESFREYARTKGLDPEDLRRGEEATRAADVRKVIWPVVIRSEILFDRDPTDSRKPHRRLRSKSAIADCYTGAASLLAICEGNPRWIIGLMEPLLAHRDDGRARGKPQRTAQKKALEVMIANYFALLTTVPSLERNRAPSSLVDLVQSVGHYFREEIVGTKFNADPVLSFTVDGGVSSSVRDMVGRGINLGAFITQVRLGPDGYKLGDVAGLKVRLSNIFAPHFNLPLIGGRTMNLSTILGRSRAENGDKLVADLFGSLR